MESTQDPVVLEFHTHAIVRGDNLFQCTYVYLDGTPCGDVWRFYPHIALAQGTRLMTREAIREWIKKGGEV